MARVAILDENDIYASSAGAVGAPSRLSGLRFHLRDTQDDAESQPQTSEKSRALQPQGPQLPETMKEKQNITDIL